MATILLVAEQAQGHLKKATLSALTAAQQLAAKNGGQIQALLIGPGAAQSAQELAPSALGVDVTPKVKVVRVDAPPARVAGIKVPDVATLVKKLHEDAKVV